MRQYHCPRYCVAEGKLLLCKQVCCLWYLVYIDWSQTTKRPPGRQEREPTWPRPPLSGLHPTPPSSPACSPCADRLCPHLAAQRRPAPLRPLIPAFKDFGAWRRQSSQVSSQDLRPRIFRGLFFCARRSPPGSCSHPKVAATNPPQRQNGAIPWIACWHPAYQTRVQALRHRPEPIAGMEGCNSPAPFAA